MKKQIYIAMITVMLFIVSISGIMVSVSAKEQETVNITFNVKGTVYSPQGIFIASFTAVHNVEFMKTGKAYHADIMWPGPPWLFPTDITGSPVVISQGKFHSWVRFISHWPEVFNEDPVPLISKFWGELTINEDGTMTGTYFDRGYCISEDYPYFFDDDGPGPKHPVQIGNSDIWYLGYTEYTVEPILA